ncbi:restriction endonuclease [Thauera sinica]|uniref:Restriction endonuclease n=1 Tax=Thauera sinica TaxID=2665146 RepID=A0ABW1ASK1_9RHOO|nr:restriction endonuclease [Thauera sp. K11]
MEQVYNADLTHVGRILSNPDYRESVTKLIREKIDRYIELFKARNIDIFDVYGNTIQYKTGADYKEYVGRAFEEAGWNISRTPVTGDQGADLVCIKAGLKLVVQCKFYSGNVGNAAVQEVHAARGFYDATHAAVISNVGFTRSAIELAGKLGILLVPDEKLEQFVRG